MKSSQLLARAGIIGHKRVAIRAAVAAACHGSKTVVVVVARRQAVGALSATVVACTAAIRLPHAFRRRRQTTCAVRDRSARMIGHVTTVTSAVPAAIRIGHACLNGDIVAARVVGWIAIRVPLTFAGRAFPIIRRACVAGSQTSAL